MRQFGLKRSHILMGFGLLACLVPLYWAKTEADKMRTHMQNQEAEVQAARKKVKTLEAEVAFLSRYDRMEKVAVEDLGMAPLNGAQIAQLKDLDIIAPVRGPASMVKPEALQEVNSKDSSAIIAKVKTGEEKQ